MGPLAFQIGEELPPQLPLGDEADDRGDFKRLARGQGRAAGQETTHVADLAAIDRHRMLDGKERGLGDHRGAVDRTAAASGGQRNVDEDDLPDGDRPSCRRRR